MTKTYVRTDYTECSYLTAGKLYEALEDEGEYFKAVDDEGDIISCRWSSCGHIYCNDWEEVTVGLASELDLKVGDVVRVVDTDEHCKVHIGSTYEVVLENGNPYGSLVPWLKSKGSGWMPLDDPHWTYEVISRANTEETPEWSSWMLSPQDGNLRNIKGEPVENFELRKVNLDPEEPQFAYRYKHKEPEPQIEEGKVYYSQSGCKWECVATHGDVAFLAGRYPEGEYSSAYVFKLDGSPVSLAVEPKYTIDFTKGEPTE